MSYSNQIICYTSPHLSLHVPFFFLLIILTHCYVIVYSFYYPPLQAYLQYKKSLSNIIHLSHRQIQVCLTVSIYYISRKICQICFISIQIFRHIYHDLLLLYNILYYLSMRKSTYLTVSASINTRMEPCKQTLLTGQFFLCNISGMIRYHYQIIRHLFLIIRQFIVHME